MPGSNPAQRVLNVLERVQTQGEQVQYTTALFAVVGQSEPPAPRNLREAARIQEALQRQIDKAEKELRAKNFGEDLYLQQFNQLRSALNPHHVVSNWGPVRTHVTTDVVLAFRWVAAAIPADGLALDDAEAQRFVESLQSILEDEFMASLPEAVGDALRAAFEGVIAALKVGPIEGAEPVAQALRSALEEVQSELETVADSVRTAPGGRRFVEKLKDTFARVRLALPKVADGIAKQGDRVDKAGKLVERGHQLANYLSQVIDSLPPPS